MQFTIKPSIKLVKAKQVRIQFTRQIASRGSMGDALTEAFDNIMLNSHEDVDWKKVQNPFHESYFQGDNFRLNEDDAKKLASLQKALQTVGGCTNPDAKNYNSEATVDDGSCEFQVPGQDQDKQSGFSSYVKGAVRAIFGPGPGKEEGVIAPYDGKPLRTFEQTKLAHFQDVVDVALKSARDK